MSEAEGGTSPARKGTRLAQGRRKIEILAVARDTTEDEIEREFDGEGYGAFKDAVAEGVVEFLAPVRERFEELRTDEDAIEATLREGAERARAIASEVVSEVRRAMGVGAPL
jgi:tryptophanyl-tRNA synthetase